MWSYQDYAKAMPLRSITNKGYDYVRNDLQIPLPGKSTLDKEFRYILKQVKKQFFKNIEQRSFHQL